MSSLPWRQGLNQKSHTSSRLSRGRRRPWRLPLSLERLEERILLSDWSGVIPNGTIFTNTED
jgi:hypothetical protein